MCCTILIQRSRSHHGKMRDVSFSAPLTGDTRAETQTCSFSYIYAKYLGEIIGGDSKQTAKDIIQEKLTGNNGSGP